MNDDNKKQKWNTAAGMGAASRIEQILRGNFDKFIKFLNKIPLMRMYFDSELSSNLENEAYIAISDAIYKTLKAIPNKGFLSKFHVIGTTIAHIVCKRLYLLKLIHHANTGRISKEQFCELVSKHLAVETATLIHKLWDVTIKLMPVLLTLGVTYVLGPIGAILGITITASPSVIAIITNILDCFIPFVKEHITQEKTEKLLITVIDYTLKSAPIIFSYMDILYNQFKSWGRMICQKFGWKEPDVLKEEGFRIYSEEESNGDVIIDKESALVIDDGVKEDEQDINIGSEEIEKVNEKNYQV